MSEIKELKKPISTTIQKCEICMISKIKTLPFKTTRQRATESIPIIHADVMGMISPASYPKRYKYISVFIDDCSRLAMAYAMKTKDETGHCLESLVKCPRNLLGKDAKVCYLRSDQGTEFTGGYTTEGLKRLNAELQLACPDTPRHNCVAERFNQTIQRKVRAQMYDSGLPKNMWDLALNAAVYVYNRTTHKSNDVTSPIQVFNTNHRVDITQLKSFGCLAYMKLQRKTGPKFKFIGRRVILVGYKETGYLFIKPEEGKFYRIRDVSFNEKLVFGNKYKKTEINDWETDDFGINPDTWFVQFNSEATEKTESERATGKRERGRPPKGKEISVQKTESTETTVYAMLTAINGDSVSYHEAMITTDKLDWIEAINNELESTNKNQVWRLMDRKTASSDGK